MELLRAKLFFLPLLLVGSIFFAPVVLAVAPVSISYQYTYGLFGGGKEFMFQTGTGMYHDQEGNTDITVTFPVSEKEMNSLYANFRRYNFDTIKTKTEKVYDRGGDIVTLRANGKTITKSNAGQSIISGEFSRWRYDRITSNLQAFVKKKLATQYRLFFVELDSSNATYQPRIAIDNEELRLYGSEGDLPLLPGQHQIAVALYNDKGKNIKGEIFLVTTPDSRIARIQVRGTDISLTAE